MNNHPASSYQQASARGASPVGMVVSLYDTILRDLRRAQAAFTAGNIETRVFELNHALTVIAHLQSVLDRQRGGEAAQCFDHFYEITRGMILDTNVRPTPESFQNLLDMYGSLRQAWQEAEHNVPGNSPQAAAVPAAAASVSPAPRTANPPDAEEAPRGNWSA
jgi:flagellar protein FliS